MGSYKNTDTIKSGPQTVNSHLLSVISLETQGFLGAFSGRRICSADAGDARRHDFSFSTVRSLEEDITSVHSRDEILSLKVEQP